ncbi:MAG: diguanylate cyclase [Gammaproteobacteria bacterium]|nr:diguanylate cyclase [Gammaproteobacteria bacterium]
MSSHNELREFHWLIGMLHSINVGLIILDKNFNIQMWNNFMANRSGIKPEQAMGKSIFTVFSELPRDWLERKINSVFLLGARAFTTWEQRPYLFKFKNYRPITGVSDFMYQNITFLPLSSPDGTIDHTGVIIYDVTDMAVNKEELEEANRQLSRLSRTDKLTELNNRGYWEECLVQEHARFLRARQPCTLIMFDIDHFKKVNDTYGHQAGDEVIRQTARTLQLTIRKTDIAGRYGGEEFGVVLINTKADNALILGERLRKRIEGLTIKYADFIIKYTISLGIAELTPQMSTHKQWLEASDQCLYQSKQNGRNQSTVKPSQ